MADKILGDSFDEDVCPQGHRKGPELASPAPVWIGRIERLERYLRCRKLIAHEASEEEVSEEIGVGAIRSTDLPSQNPANNLLRVSVKAQPTTPPRDAVFATFPADRVSQPFASELGRRNEAVTALGLGHFKDVDWLLAVLYQPGAAALRLHVPTVCDAGSFNYFRPAQPGATADPECGFTCPLPPPPDLAGQPEIVHQLCAWQFDSLV